VPVCTIESGELHSSEPPIVTDSEAIFDDVTHSTRPYLSPIEKKWISFQILSAMRDSRARDVSTSGLQCGPATHSLSFVLRSPTATLNQRTSSSLPLSPSSSPTMPRLLNRPSCLSMILRTFHISTIPPVDGHATSHPSASTLRTAG